MAEPATGTAAAVTALTATSGGLLAISTIMPPGASLYEFVWGMAFAMFGAFCFQFIEAFAERQKSAQAGVPISDRPRIDMVLLGYAVLGAPLSAAMLIWAIHQFKGATGFGDTTWLQSAAGFMAAGPVGPKIVIKAVATIVVFASSKFGGKSP